MTHHEFDIYVELYKRKQYNKIPIGEYPNGDYFYMTSKQVRAMELLNDNTTTHVGYGGSARSGKSIIECTAIILDCIAYPDIAWGLARKELTTLKRTVLITMFNQLSFYGFKAIIGTINNKDEFNYNQQLNKISFFNKSDVFLIDSMYKPSDPLNTRFGGFELTKSAIDESNETNITVVNKLFERTGWRNNDTYGIKRKQFECFNPDKNHVYSRFYIPFRDEVEPAHKKFIPALPSDNPNPSVKEWIDDIVRTGDTATIERQIHGNFDYDDDPSKLCDYDAICDAFTNTHVKGGSKVISADLAMQGRDKFIAGYWDGLICEIAIDKGKSSGKSIELDLKELKNTKGVGNSNIVADSDGLGAYLDSYIENIKTFHGGANAVDKETYSNLKSECAFKLAEVINNRQILIICKDEQQELIKQELSICLKRDNVDAYKKAIIKKPLMKEKLGRSPDYMDMLLMRMYFEINKDELVFPEAELSTYKEIPTELKDSKEVKKGFPFAFISTPDEGLSTFSMPIFRVIDNYIYLEDVIFNRDELIDQEIKVKDKLVSYDIKRIAAETSKALASFKTRIQEKNPNTEIYGQWSDIKKMPRILGYSGIIKKHFLFPENPNEETKLFIQQVFKLIKTSSDETEAASSLSGSAKHLESHYGLFK